MIGIAFTGSGKTLAFCLPLIMMAAEEEKKLPFTRGEGPVGVILCPSVSGRVYVDLLYLTLLQRELANQTYENVLAWATALAQGGYPQVNTLLCMGGINMSEQSHVFQKGIHIVVATPGRLKEMLEKKKFTFDFCKYFCMDEADRMIDLGFEEEVRHIMSFFKVRFSVDEYFEFLLTLAFRLNGRLSCSQPRCRRRSKTLPNSPSSSPYL